MPSVKAGQIALEFAVFKLCQTMTGETKNRHKMNLVKMNLAKIEPFEKAVIKKLAKLATVSHFCGLKKAFSRNLAWTNCIKFRQNISNYMKSKNPEIRRFRGFVELFEI